MQGQQDGKNEDGTMLLMCAVETARQSHGPLLICADAFVKIYMTRNPVHDFLHLSSSMHGMKLTCLTQ